MEFLDEKLEDYVNAHTSPESEILSDLNRQTHISVLQPRMLSGHLQGRTLSLFSKMIQPKRILEIGTYTGYSAICMAEGLKENGKLITIDVNYELEEMVKNYVETAGFSNQIEMKVGDAMDLIPKLDKNFDLVFIDADKSNYSNYYDLLIDDLPKGAFMIADNVLWSGKVIEPVKKNDIDTEALIIFNKKIQDDDRVENVLLPIRDGLMVIGKK
ncbi:O-methyltransferase [Brumimicrobium glaciale]|uniref:O-methyltransferase n=1 Tax=Brumimicrobium glaciale TaxID=200475 RepID=A0A4Q4KLW6_9FLAO|nr:O-methyltransferase [Brumimicrobium glaciale]RYM33364.1 O-methyltransferase [Brumimicrobium glaciale]